MTARGRLLGMEQYNSRSFHLITEEAIEAVEAAAIATERARFDELLEALDAYMNPDNQFTHSRWHAVEAARAALGPKP